MSEKTETPAAEKSYIEKRIDELVAAGSAKRGLGPIPDELLATPPIDLGGDSVLEQLLRDRHEDD